MIYLSLFNGISAGRLALSRVGIEFDKYYIAEIDKFANKVSEFHYPDNIQLGDVNNWREWDIDWSSVSLVTAGFPCQSWSLAGKQLGDKDERGQLFWVTLEIINHVLDKNPHARFMLENVKMKREFEEYITLHAENALGKVFKTLINSSLVSAQNRNRYYWTNFPLTQPEDSNVLLRDIIDFRVNEKLSDGEYSYMSRCRDGDKPRLETRTKDALHDEKSFTLTSNCYKGVPYNVIKLNESITKDGKSYCLTSSYRFGANAKHSITKKQRTLASVTETDEVNSMVHNNILYRKLTPTECARLQTFPDGWCENIISNSQSYKAYDNAWTVDVITHIFECMERHNSARRDTNVRFDNDVIWQSSIGI